MHTCMEIHFCSNSGKVFCFRDCTCACTWVRGCNIAVHVLHSTACEVYTQGNFVVRIIEDSDNQGWYTEGSLYSNPHSSHSFPQPCTTTVPFLYTTPLAHVGSAYWSTTSRYSNSSSLSSLVSTGTSLPPPPWRESLH